MIEELVELIMFQQQEIERLSEIVKRIEQYISVYEEYIKGE